MVSLNLTLSLTIIPAKTNKLYYINLYLSKNCIIGNPIRQEWPWNVWMLTKYICSMGDSMEADAPVGHAVENCFSHSTGLLRNIRSQLIHLVFARCKTKLLKWMDTYTATATQNASASVRFVPEASRIVDERAASFGRNWFACYNWRGFWLNISRSFCVQIIGV